MITRRKLLGVLTGLPIFGGLFGGRAEGAKVGDDDSPDVVFVFYRDDGTSDESKAALLVDTYPGPKRHWWVVNGYEVADEKDDDFYPSPMFCGVKRDLLAFDGIRGVVSMNSKNQK